MDDGDIKSDIGHDFEPEFRDSGFVPLPILLNQREIGKKSHPSVIQHFECWREEYLVESRPNNQPLSQLTFQLPGTPKSTFLMVFSPDGCKVASTHGDHNIYVCDVRTGKCLCTLKGHPRTPWSIAFHPSCNDIVASGCLDGQVRVWDLKGGSEVWIPERKRVISSLAFHPSDQVLVIATDNELYFWDWFCKEPFAKISTASEKEKIKYVKFDRLGHKLITGIANVANNDRRCHEPPSLATSRNHPNYQLGWNSRTGRYAEICNRARQNYLNNPANLESNRTPDSLSATENNFRRLYARSVGSRSSENRDESLRDPLMNADEDMRLGEIRHPLRPGSNDSASSSSLDSNSSITSGVSGTSNERNTRLSLLWTSRLNRTGNESDNSAGGGYDLEERRGEGSVMRGEMNDYAEVPGGGGGNRYPNTSQGRFRGVEEDDSDAEVSLRRDPPPGGGQGGRWMYYRGNSRTKNVSSRPREPHENGIRTSGSHSRVSPPGFFNDGQGAAEGLNSIAVPGPSGVSQRVGSALPPLPLHFSPRGNVLDPQFGVQLLSRHIENMQRICRSLSLPRANLELTRHRHEITRLQQIRSMLYDIQHQIRSLRSSVDRTLSEEFLDEPVNSLPHTDPVRTDPLDSSNSTVADQVDLEGTLHNSSDNFSTLAEEDPDQILPSVIPRSLPGTGASTGSPISRTFRSASVSRMREGARLQRAPSNNNRVRSSTNSRNRLVWPWLIHRLPQRRRQSRGARTNVGASVRPSDGILARSSVGMNRLSPRIVREARLNRGLRQSPNLNRNYVNVRIRRRLSGANDNSLTDRSTNVDAPARGVTRVPSTPNSSAVMSRLSAARLRVNRYLEEDFLTQQSAPIQSPIQNRQNERYRGGNRFRLLRSDSSRFNVPRNQNELDDLNNNSSGRGLPDGDEDNALPERISRAGPPTTSLSSRISVMLAEQESARHRTSTLAPSASNSGGTQRWNGTPSTLPSRFRRSNSPHWASGVLPPVQPYFNEEEFLLRDIEDSDMFDQSFLRSLRSLRREIMTSHRTRLFGSNLTTGGDLAGSSWQMDPNSGRENLREMRRDRYRQMLQIMADRLNRLMNRSFLNQHLRQYPGGAFEPEDEFHPLNLSASGSPSGPSDHRRLMAIRRDPEAPNIEGGMPSSAASAIDNHMRNLRLLVRLALHLIYQLLNFICNQNVSYEERPISRLPNPFREEETSSATENPQTGSANSDQGAFEFDIEPGLHNLTTLLETVRMTSEELRNNVLATAEQLTGSRSEFGQGESSSHPLSNGTGPPAEGGQEEASRSRISAHEGREGPFQPASSSPNNLPNNNTNSGERGSAVRRLTNFLIRSGGYRFDQNSNWASQSRSLDLLNGLDDPSEEFQNPFLQLPIPAHPRVSSPSPLVIPQIVLSNSEEGVQHPQPTLRHENLDVLGTVGPSAPIGNDDLNFHLRTFGGIPLRFLGRQNAVDRRSPDSEDSVGTPPPHRREDNADNSGPRPTQPMVFYSSRPGFGSVPQGFHFLDRGLDMGDADSFMFFNRTIFSPNLPYRYVSGPFYDPYSPLFVGTPNPTHRIQAWDFSHFQIPDISDSCCSLVVPKCKIHFDASVSISDDGRMLAALIPETPHPLTSVCVFSLETKMLGQILYSSIMDSNTICVSISPTMKHLVVGIASYHTRLSIHHNEKQLVASIYRLSDSPVYKSSSGHGGTLQYLKRIELQRDHRLGSLNCIRWMPFPGQGLIYGTNRGQLTILR